MKEELKKLATAAKRTRRIVKDKLMFTSLVKEIAKKTKAIKQGKRA